MITHVRELIDQILNWKSLEFLCHAALHIDRMSPRSRFCLVFKKISFVSGSFMSLYKIQFEQSTENHKLLDKLSSHTSSFSKVFDLGLRTIKTQSSLQMTP